MIPAQHSIESADIFTSSADYARRFRGETGQWMLDVQSDGIKRLLKNRTIRHVLDVGGGHGQLVAPLIEIGAQVTILGSDARCQLLIESALTHGDCTFKVGSLTSIPEATRSFDLVTCIRFISHCEEWRRLIGELCRVAENGVIIDYPPLISWNLLSPLTFKLKKLIEGNTRTFSIFSHREIESEFKKHGFSLVARDGLFGFPMVMHRLLQNRKISQHAENIAQRIGLRTYFGSPTLALFCPTS